jgi:thiol:disulfide interchange protein DsbC
MKKILGIGLLTLSLFASDKILNQNEALKILKATPIYNQVAPKLKKGLKVKGQDKGDFYLITVYDKRGEGNIFITKNLKYTILGNILNNQTKQIIRPTYPAEPFSGNKQTVKDGVVFTIGHGKKDLYVVTDPECPFCQKLEKLAEESHLGDKYTIHVIFLPLPFHKHSKAMIDYILSANDNTTKAKRFKETLDGGKEWQKFTPTKKQKAKIDAIIKKSVNAANELGAKGTPSFYDKNMNEIKDRGSIFK